ncbi:MAG TPA: hypothetical protein VJN94_01670, partial [Candidatus Binataceae bacterium]|nr:hypothetical protein [Candidatus Binataceae bacterium]
KLTEGDPERLRRAQEFQDNIDEVFSFRGARRALEDVPGGNDSIITIAREARLLAGFSEEEIERLVNAARKSAAY